VPKPPKRPRDPNQLAKLIVDIATGQAQEAAIKPSIKQDMVALGRAGGLKGGRARSESLTADKRSEIAKAAAAARWIRGEGGEK